MTSLYAVILLGIFILASIVYLKRVSKSKSSRNQIERILDDIKNIKTSSELDAKLEKIYIGSKASAMMLETAAKVADNNIKRALVEKALLKKDDEIVEIIKVNYNKFDTESKHMILEYLSVYGSSESMELYVEFLINDHMIFTSLPLDKLTLNPRYSDIVFPRLMQVGLAEEKRYQLYNLINSYLANKLLFSDKLEPIRENVLSQYKNIAYDYERYNDRSSQYWRYDLPMYMETRSKILTLIELLGYIYDDDSFLELKRALKFNDPLINAYALISLIKLGESIDDYVITMEKLCEFPSVRRYLYSELEKLNLKTKFPYEFRSQQYLAQSEIFNLFASEARIYAEAASIKFHSKIDISDKYSMYVFVCEVKYSKEDNLKTILAYSGPFLNDEVESSGRGLTSIRYAEVDEDELSDEYVHSLMRDKINDWLLKL